MSDDDLVRRLLAGDAQAFDRAAYGVIHQPHSVYELQVEDGLSSFFPPEQVEQVTLGFQRRVGASGSLRVDAYGKRYSDVRPLFANLFDAYELIPEAQPDRVRVDALRARVRGVEAMARGHLGSRLSGWLGYAWSQAEEHDGEWRPRLWDQRHAATGSLQWEGVKWRASLTSIYHTGWPTTPLRVIEVANPDGSTRLEASLGPRNSERLGSFWRVDLRASRQVRLDRGALTWYLEVFNLLNRDNPCCIEDFDVLAVPGDSLATRPNYDHWLPLLPSFGVLYEF
jgi:outer membrane receptor protein involved in Fe transport